jgi:hypothetical protein
MREIPSLLPEEAYAKTGSTRNTNAASSLFCRPQSAKIANHTRFITTLLWK